MLTHICQTLDCPKDSDCGPCGANSQSCTLNCIGTDICKGSHSLTCKSGVPCTLNCDGSNACTDSTLIANGATSVTVICSGSNACTGNTRLNCQSGSPCDITCHSGTCNSDNLQINVNNAYGFECNGNCPPSISAPYAAPTQFPTPTPTTQPTPAPTKFPTASPTSYPTPKPTQKPTSSPTIYPTSSPTPIPTKNPTAASTLSPTKQPTPTPSKFPTVSPTSSPTIYPTAAPTNDPTPSSTNYPTKNPTLTSEPTNHPTVNPAPSPSDNPTLSPTNQVTLSPTNNPTISPIEQQPPSHTLTPTINPTHDLSSTPTIPPPTNPSKKPTITPTQSSSFTEETHVPSQSATNNPSTGSPTNAPTSASILTSIATKSVDNDNGRLNSSESQSLWYNQRYLLFGLLGLLFCCLSVCLIAFIWKQRWNKKRHKRYLQSHASVLRIINADAAISGNNMDTNTAKHKININPPVPIQRLESMSSGSDKLEIEEGIDSNVATNGTSYNQAINMVDEYFVNPIDANNINIAVGPHIDDDESESNSSNSSDDEHDHQINISMINTQTVTKGNDAIIEEDSFTEDSTDKQLTPYSPGITPYGQNEKEHIVSMASYDEEVIGDDDELSTSKGIGNQNMVRANDGYIDIDKLVEGHQQTKGALSSVNNAMFKENVNNAVIMEQVILNDVVDDMDGDIDINDDDDNNDDIHNEGEKVRSQIIGDNMMNYMVTPQ